MASKVFLAVDLGASGGRVVAGVLQDGQLTLDPLYRFANGPVRVGARLHWDLLGLWSHVQAGLRAAADKYGSDIASVGVDTWGVDYGLLSGDDELLGNPYHYRDRRTQGMFERAFQIVPREEIFAETGLQFMELNTLYQLLASRLSGSRILDLAEVMLLMPDLFHWLLTGTKVVEQTNASTTQLYNPTRQSWSTSLVERLDLPTTLFGPIVPPGTNLGRLSESVAAETNLSHVDVVLPGTHDTASAVFAVPAVESLTPESTAPDWCYISSGTWSLMGVETPAPLINDDVARLNFTNEGGVGGTTRLLQNIAGLWPVQQCRQIWQRQGMDLEWDALTEAATAAKPLARVIDLDDPRLVAPHDMTEAIAQLCRAAQQPEPDSPGATVRCCLESLALRYRQVHGQLQQLVGRPIETIHIVGGGSQNELLSQLTADACDATVVTGPVEATAIGNMMVQAQAAGEVADKSQARQLIRESFPMRTFQPNPAHGDAWRDAAERSDPCR